MTAPRPTNSDHCPYCGGSDWDWPNLGVSWDEDDVVVCTVCRAIWMNGEWTEGNVKQNDCPVCGASHATHFEKHGNHVVQCRNCEYEVYDGDDGTPAIALWNQGYIDEEAKQEALAYIRYRDTK